MKILKELKKVINDSIKQEGFKLEKDWEVLLIIGLTITGIVLGVNWLIEFATINEIKFPNI